MRVYINDQLIRRRARFGNIASWVGLAVLVGGMAASLSRRPELIYVSFACLVVGFLAANIGTYQLRRFGRKPRPDEVLVRSLKGFDDRYAFYAWTLPSPYVLIGPPGIFVLVTRDQSGQVIGQGSRWRQPFRFSRILTAMGQEGLGNPTKELLEETERLGAWLANKLHEEDLPEVQGAIVFIHPNVQLTLENPTAPVVTASKLKEWLRGRSKQKALADEQRERLETALRETLAAQK